MGRKAETKSRGLDRLRQAANAVKRAFSRRTEENAEPVSTATAPPRRERATAPKARPKRRETDIPFDVLDHAYTPPLTSSKASFRSDGSDHQQDQDFFRSVDETSWSDEDHYTNKSGDPRIGTHGRTYEATRVSR